LSNIVQRNQNCICTETHEEIWEIHLQLLLGALVSVTCLVYSKPPRWLAKDQYGVNRPIIRLEEGFLHTQNNALHQNKTLIVENLKKI